MEFKDRLKKARKDKGLSQSRLADDVGVHVTNVSRYERGENKPTTEVLLRLADALDISADFLMGGSIDDAASGISDKELLMQFKKAASLPDADRRLVKEFLGAFLFQRDIKERLAG